MSNALAFYSLWAINDVLDPIRLKNQLDDFKKSGLDGVVFHPRFYPNVPAYLSREYLDIVSKVILHAKDIGMRFWIYDENGWPSGTVGGELLQRYPNDAQQWLGLVNDQPQDCVGQFEHAGRLWYLERHHGPGVDYLSHNLADHFIELTYERYKTGLTPTAFEYVEAFFCDEPEFGLGHAFDSLPPDGAIPWTTDLPELYHKRYDEDLTLNHLFFSTDDAAKTRIQFWEMLLDLFCESFIAPINAWCVGNGKLFAAHIKGEEHPLFQVQMVGSCDVVFRNLSLPGIDSLERDPGNDYFPRQLASSAAQFGTGRCMVEAFGGAGWGATPEDLERYLMWLGRHGVTDFIMHLSQYRLNSDAICDWPPSQPLHLTWRDAYPEVLRHVRERLTNERPPAADTLVVTPHRGVMAAYEPWELTKTNIHNAATYPSSPAAAINTRFLEQVESLGDRNITPHYADESTFEKATLENDYLRLGHMVYKYVVVAEGALLSEHGRIMADLFRAPSYKPRPNTQTTAQSAGCRIALNPNWTMHAWSANQFVLDAKADGSGNWSAEFECEPGLDLDLSFADPVTQVSVNGHGLILTDLADRYAAKLDPESLDVRMRNILHFTSGTSSRRPVVWLQGAFLVRSLAPTPYCAGPDGTCQTEGPFLLVAQKTEMPPATVEDLIPEGYPFCRTPLVVRTRIALEGNERADTIRFVGIAASASRLTIDGVSAGFAYGPNWSIKLPNTLHAGWHDLELELIPSGYNFYGPHHHIGGDLHVVSPDQFLGRKNFADPADAPEYTHSQTWRFVPLRAPRELIIDIDVLQ